MAITLRRAEPDDVEFLLALLDHDDVDPFLGLRRPRDREALLEEVDRSVSDPSRFGRMIIELDGARAGTLGYHELSPANRIAHLDSLAIHPAFRGRRLADEAARQVQRYLLVDLDYHRLEMACYGFNARAIAHAERSGFVREGVKRKAYLRHGEWQDAVQFAILREDLGVQPAAVV